MRKEYADWAEFEQGLRKIHGSNLAMVPESNVPQGEIRFVQIACTSDPSEGDYVLFGLTAGGVVYAYGWDQWHRKSMRVGEPE